MSLSVESDLTTLIERNICVFEILSYFDSIFDYKSLILTNKSIMYLINKNKRLIRLISEGNLNLLINHQLNLSYIDFKNKFLLPFGLVLSGSTMLYSICGKNWGFHKTNNNSNLVPLYENVFSEEQIKFIHDNNINKTPDDYDLYINTSEELTIPTRHLICNNFSITDELEKNFQFHLDYTFPSAEEQIHYLIAHIQNLRDIGLCKIMLSTICGETVNDIGNIRIFKTISTLKRIFDVMYNYRYEILSSYSLLHDVNNQYYNKINIMRLYHYSKYYKKKVKLQIIFNNEYETKFNNYDFKFLKTYLDPVTENLNGGINYNDSLKSILSRNDINKMDPYKHVSSTINPDKQILCRSKFPVLLATNYDYNKTTFVASLIEMVKSGLIRSLKYSSRGFNCMHGLKEYNFINLPNLYLNMKTSFHVNQTTKFNSYLYYLVKVEDRVIFQSVWMIYDIGISLYNTTINSNIPNIEYLRKNALTYNEEHEFEGEENEY
jgi:hypothetical protein